MHPILVGVINAIFPGVGYLVLRKRTVFGVLILISTVAWIAIGLVEPVADNFFFSTTAAGKALEGIAILSALIAFGYDAYLLAKEN